MKIPTTEIDYRILQNCTNTIGVHTGKIESKGDPDIVLQNWGGLVGNHPPHPQKLKVRVSTGKNFRALRAQKFSLGGAI